MLACLVISPASDGDLLAVGSQCQSECLNTIGLYRVEGIRKDCSGSARDTGQTT